MRNLLALALVAGVLAGACSSPSSEPQERSGTRPSDPDVAEVALEPFADCDELVAFTDDLARAAREGSADLQPDVGARESFAADAAAAGPSLEPGEDFSTTNDQEAGVDEADLVKTNGELVITTVDGVLRVVDASVPEPTLVGTLDLPDGGPHELLLHGDRVLVLSSSTVTIPPEQQGDRPSPGSRATTLVSEVDVSDPAEPRLVGSRHVDGSYRTARLTDGTARIVLAAQPSYAAPMPVTEDVLDRRDELVEQAVERWLPAVTTVAADGTVERAPLVGCDEVIRPVVEEEGERDAPTGAGGPVTVLSIDLDEPLGDDLQATTVLGTAEHVYASTENLYLAGTVWGDAVGEPRLEIHQLSLIGDGPATYVASGSVDGYALDQFAFSEHGGALRVATTDAGSIAFDGARADGSGAELAPDVGDSAITVLERQDGALVEVGHVDGMGQGEEVYAVRFLGETAYVVTFRRTDPLYTVDLSDPRAPQVVGELKILGYSAYLHPIGDDLVLGVGQDAGEDGRVRGTQVSLFDVSDLANPVRVQQFTMPSGSSEVEYDHRAFLWWAPENLAVIPHAGYDRGWSYHAVLGLEVTPDGIAEVGRVQHDPPDVTPVELGQCPPTAACAAPPDDALVGGDAIVRSLVVNRDELWTVSASGIEISDVDTLTEEHWIGFSAS